MPRRPTRARGDRRGTVADRPRHRDQARPPLVPVRVPLRITPTVRTPHPTPIGTQVRARGGPSRTAGPAVRQTARAASACWSPRRGNSKRR